MNEPTSATPSTRPPAEGTLPSSDQQFRMLVEGVKDYAIFMLDPQGRVITWNAGAERINGYRAEEILGAHFSRFYPQSDLDAGKPQRELEIAAREGKYEEEGWRIRKGGARFWASVVITAVFDASGTLRGYSKVTRDITERREGERIRSIVDNVIDGIITIDEYGIIESFNPAAERIFGYRSEEVLGQNVKLLMPPPYTDAHDSYIANYLRTEMAKVIGIGREVQGRRKDGSLFPLDLAVGEFHIQGRRAFTGVVRDITERKKAAEQLRFFAEELQQRNAELARSNQELDEFAHVASHDLKEPLRGIYNYATFLLEDQLDRLTPDGQAKLQTLTRLAQRMESLIESLLHFSRAGRVELAMQLTDLNVVLAHTLESLRIVLEEQRVELRVPGPLPAVVCDRVRVGEVFLNLISNAAKYNDKPSKWVEIGWQESPGPPVFYVRDNGIGIRPRHTDTIFRIFKRLHGRDQFGGGTGVGLTIVKKILERHGGRIWVESTPGEGTTFFFTFQPTKE